MAELVFRANGVGGTITYAMEYYDPVTGSDRHDSKHRNSTIRSRYILTDEQTKLPLDDLVRMAAKGELPRWEPKSDIRTANEKAVADAVEKLKGNQ